MSTPIIYFSLLTGHPDATPRMPSKAHPGDAGYDLYVSRDVVIPRGDFLDVHVDVAVAMPEGIWGRITGRSSTIRKHGLLVTEGIIDNGYRGELFIGVLNLTDGDIRVAAGHRLAQFIPAPLVDLTWIAAAQLPDSSRGAKGFGSSGA